jgi:hypothetical protein
MAVHQTEFTNKIIDGCIKNDLTGNSPVTRLHFKLGNGQYVRVIVSAIRQEDVQNIRISEGCLVMVDSDYTLKYIDIALLCGFEHEEYGFDEWCNIPNSEKVKEKYPNYISSALYECILGGVSAIL